MSDELFGRPHPVARTTATPAHSLIEQWFLDVIARGELAAGDRLPREQDLAGVFGVSRMTLRQALAGLELRGIIERVPGRSGGTFVVEPKIECDLTGLAGFTEQLRRAELDAQAKILSATTVPATRSVANALGCGREDPVHEVVRIRSADGTPLALERSYFPAALFADLLQQDLSGSLYRLLAERYDAEPRTATEYLEPVIPSPDEAAALELDAGQPAMLIDRTAATSAGLPVEYARDLFRSDRVRISVRSGWQAAPGTV